VVFRAVFIAGCPRLLRGLPAGRALPVGKPFQAVITINVYLSIATKLILALGLCFETPILVFFLARMGIVTERWLLAKFKYAVLVIFIGPSSRLDRIATQCVFAYR
jgi:sec-independent protein translocase protein TatC